MMSAPFVRKTPTSRPRCAGFTVIELLTVVVILGVLAALAAPSFTGYLAAQALKGAAAEAHADLQYARSESVSRNSAVQVTFSSTGYTIAQVAPAVTIKTVTLDASNTIGSGADMVATFDPVRATATVTGGPPVFSNPRTSGTLTVSVNTMGRGTVCSTGGSIKGYPSC